MTEEQPQQSELADLKVSNRNRPKSKLKKVGGVILLLVAVFTLVYLILNAPALWAKLRYYYQTDLLDKNYQEYTSSNVPVSDLPSPYIFDDSMPVTVDQNPDSPTPQVSLDNNQLYIPKIDVRVPIIWNIPGDKAMEKLREGVVHIKPTALPGQQKGNVFITGHSSYYYWDPGKYKHVFALLPQLKKEQYIYIQASGQLFKYRIYQTITVKPEATWVMKPTDRSIVSLMTCVPIGTSLRRFVVRAEQIEPNPAKSKSKKEPADRWQDIPEDLLPNIF